MMPVMSRHFVDNDTIECYVVDFFSAPQLISIFAKTFSFSVFVFFSPSGSS